MQVSSSEDIDTLEGIVKKIIKEHGAKLIDKISLKNTVLWEKVVEKGILPSTDVKNAKVVRPLCHWVFNGQLLKNILCL